jgi:hypothetical protein
MVVLIMTLVALAIQKFIVRLFPHADSTCASAAVTARAQPEPMMLNQVSFW